LAHLISAHHDGRAQHTDQGASCYQPGPNPAPCQCGTTHPAEDARLARATAAAAHLIATGQRVSRRTLRAAGIKGSNTHLAALARILGTEPAPSTNGNRNINNGSGVQ
jgi:hypothetical protein